MMLMLMAFDAGWSSEQEGKAIRRGFLINYCHSPMNDEPWSGEGDRFRFWNLLRLLPKWIGWQSRAEADDRRVKQGFVYNHALSASHQTVGDTSRHVTQRNSGSLLCEVTNDPC